MRFPINLCLRGWLLAFAAQTLAADEGPAPLTRVADIRRLSREELAKRPPAALRGVVTFALTHGDLVVDDGEGIFARWIAPRSAGKWEGKLGDVVEVKGTARAGMYAPIVEIGSVEVVGRSALPAAHAVPVAELFSGKYDSQQVAVRGVVQWVHTEPGANDAGEQRVDLVADGRLVVARFFSKGPLDRARLIDAEVRVAGVATQDLNTRREAIGAALRVRASEEFVIERPAPAAPWESPLVEISRVAAFRVEGLPQHRIRVRGVVSLAVPGESFYIQDEVSGLRVQSFQADALAPGDEVEVLGFVLRGERFAELGNAAFRKMGAGAPLAAREVGLGEIFSASSGTREKRGSDLDGRLVALRGVLQSVERTATGGARVYVLAEGQSIAATLGAGREADALRRLLPGSLVRVAGVCVLEFDTTVRPGVVPERVTRFQLLLREARDVTLLRAPPWWTPRRLWMALGVVCGGAALAVGWTLVLRRVVARQAVVIAKSTEALVLRDERSRMARELHDTLEQHLTSVRMQVETATDDLTDSPAEARTTLATALGMLRFSHEEVRRAVWSLRTHELEAGGLVPAIRALFPPTDSGPRVEFTVAGTVRRLPAVVEFHLLRIAQEAVTNARKHAGAGGIAVALDFGAESITLAVSDDGCGFDSEAATTDGTHFGLLGMRERANKINGRLAIERGPGGGARVTVTAPISTLEPIAP